ncbi:MAG: beta-ketoacyl-ACP synthase 3 [Pseudonocardiaceae bacterium]|nr:beta-ketoacyl-ACP synthase 3 [Pseudonocardiaceae bacterium]
MIAEQVADLTAATPGRTEGNIGVLGTGAYLPEHVVANTEIGPPAGVSDEWIIRKTGIHSRRYAERGEATSDLCLSAAHASLKESGLTPDDLSLIVVATSTPDSPQPPTAAVLAAALGAPPTAAAFDLNAVCSGFVFAVDVARRFLTAGCTGHALVLGADLYSRIINPSDRKTAVLLGDGAGAAVLGPVEHDRGILATQLMTFGEYQDLVQVAAGGSRLPTSAETLAQELHYFTMQGREVANFVRTHIPKVVDAFLSAHDFDAADVRHLVPHQANGNLIQTLAADLSLPTATTHTTVDRYGNTGAASVAVTLDDAAKKNLFEPGQLVLLAGFGGGMSIGLALIRW